MKAWIEAVDAAVGPKVARICALLVALGIAALVWGAFSAQPGRTLAALVSSWLFFTGIAAGGIAFSAILHLCGARWAGPLHDVTWRLADFLPAAAVVQVCIVAGLTLWAPWVHHMAPHESFWLSTPSFVLRELLVSQLLYGFAYRFVRPQVRANSRRPRDYVLFGLLFAVVLSIWSFDFVVGPSNAWNSTLIGPHVFVGAFMSGGGVATLLALRAGRLSAGQRRDAGTLILVLAIFWAYQCWAQFLTMWYGNLPDEVGVLLRRSGLEWRAETALIILSVAVLPFLLLINPRGRIAKRTLAIAALSQVLGLWLERDLMVAPALGGPAAQPLDLAGTFVELGVLGLFVLTTWRAFAKPTGAPEPARQDAAAHAHPA